MAEGHWEKLHCRAVYARILKNPLDKTKQISVASSLSIPFFSLGWPQKCPFGPFSGPRGGKGRSENANLAATRKLHLIPLSSAKVGSNLTHFQSKVRQPGLLSIQSNLLSIKSPSPARRLYTKITNPAVRIGQDIHLALRTVYFQ